MRLEVFADFQPEKFRNLYRICKPKIYKQK
ncbi:hypothetical protein barba126A_phanotate48 [Rheinheimera phage vB_RspM_barba_12-6A]|nr:hypothetical protein barba109A_phanotate164 [Rheinheimera phage vB_RspM_barba_10-9A]QNO02322.1 hypothetical protein barba109B_phanotate164 [Rheinheimera phage vB_RspM_barba_10-9B]QNO02329.1 hypothetical protein barba109C_phanotate8 [Rheinheimera phage vB_RspM_barba_10-9C]QNO02641.1 hypothetical protein barba109D_phanotate157 [Rheinheimera phage vB_RspM_barba_10-9D]QNO02749.1 hypothetical protein barba109E_phanotate101 [Rheinheimera phage vB_RspM_barba_10-9E]QNO02970.1 hypothetical protein b